MHKSKQTLSKVWKTYKVHHQQSEEYISSFPLFNLKAEKTYKHS